MTVARREVVDEGSRGVYHCMARCVRRAFLCGWDAYSGRDFEHRKSWVQQRLETLAGCFGLEVFAYAVMSNHLHVVVRNRPDVAAGWSPEEVAGRWLKVFPKRRTKEGLPARPSEAEIAAIVGDPERVAELRGRLSSISWFMKSLNEWVARRANREDRCRGRFWEGRFKCQLLADEAAILACMAYVDLNPVRAGMADSLEDCEFTAAFDRIQARQGRDCVRHIGRIRQDKGTLTPRQKEMREAAREQAERGHWLAPLDGQGSPLSNVSEASYLELLDWTGRQLRADKRGAIPASVAPILDQLDINTERWLRTVERYGGLFFRVAGRVENMKRIARAAGLRWLRGIEASRAAFTPQPVPV
jgi:REP element-mobilizing transposase RayT